MVCGAGLFWSSVGRCLLPFCISQSRRDEGQYLEGTGGQMIPDISQREAKKGPFPGQNLALPATQETSAWCQLLCKLSSQHTNHTVKNGLSNKSNC